MAAPLHAKFIYLAGESSILSASWDSENDVFFQNVFDGQDVINFSDRTLNGSGTTANQTFVPGQIVTSGALAGQDFAIFGWSRSSIQASEITALTDFYNAGGNLFLVGEGATAFNNLNRAINSILASIGSTMRLNLSAAANFDAGSFTTLPVTTQTAFGTGVNTWRTAFASGINLGSEGTAIISGTGDNGPGVGIGFQGTPPMAAIPLPAAGWLMVAGLGGLGLLRRRKTRA